MRDHSDLSDVQIAETLLEESYVLHIECTPGQVTLAVHFALTHKHPDYAPPKRSRLLARLVPRPCSLSAGRPPG